MTIDQRMAALAYANRIRSCHADWKRRLRTRRATLTEATDDPLTGSMKVIDLLLALPQVGRVRAMKFLRRAEISPTARIENLTARQVECLQNADFRSRPRKTASRLADDAKAR